MTPLEYWKKLGRHIRLDYYLPKDAIEAIEKDLVKVDAARKRAAEKDIANLGTQDG